MKQIAQLMILAMTVSVICLVWNTLTHDGGFSIKYARVRLQSVCNHSQTYAPEQRYLHSVITVIIKTVNRRTKVSKLVESIKKLYLGKLTIIIGDDGHVNETDLYQEEGILDGRRVEYVWFGYDVGLSAGRNRLVRLCKTEYIVNMDDDMQWTERTDIYKLLRVIQKTNTDIVTMALREGEEKHHYLGELYMEEKKIVFCKHDFSEDPKKRCPIHKTREMAAEYMCYAAGIGLNIFLARRDFLLEHPWNEELKVREHELWYWEIGQSTPAAKIVGCIDVEAYHNNGGNSDEYMKMRNREVKQTQFNYEYSYEYDPRCCKLAHQWIGNETAVAEQRKTNDTVVAKQRGRNETVVAKQRGKNETVVAK